MPSSESRNEPRRPTSEPARTDFGTFLRETREQRGISLRQIAAATKISLMALEALERGDVRRLPGGIFTRAFVRAYAQEVGLDPERAVREFLACYPSEAPDDESMVPSRLVREDEQEEQPARVWYGRAWRVAGVAVPLALVVAYFTVGGRPAPSERSLPGAPPAAAPSSTAPAESPTSGAGPSTPEKTEAAASPVGALQARSRSGPGEPARPEVDPEEARIVVRLAPTEECWVLMRVDRGRPEQQLMRAGEARELRARDEILLTLGNAGAMVYSLNGQPGRPLGAPGAVVKDLRFTPQNYRTFLSVPQRP